MQKIIFIKGVQYQILENNKEKKIALLKRVSKLEQCFTYGGQYAVVRPKEGRFAMKEFLCFDASIDMYKQLKEG